MKATAKETVLMENGAFRLTTQRLVQTDGLEAEITKEGNLRISAHGQERTVEIPKKLPKGCAAYHGSIPVLGAMYNLAIKEHAVAVSNDLREGRISTNDLLDRLGADGRLKLTRDEIQAIYDANAGDTGMAGSQVDAFAAMVKELADKFPAGVGYTPGAIL